MDSFVAYLLIKQISWDNTIALAHNKNNTVKKERQINKNCSRCGQNAYWCQCDIDNVDSQLSNTTS